METVSAFSVSGRGVVLAPNKKYPLNQTPLTFQWPQKKLIALVGPNGSGKTTLLKSILGESVLAAGEIFLEGGSVPVQRWSAAEVAKKIAYVPQEHQFPAELPLKSFLQLAFLGGAGLFGKLPPFETPAIQTTLSHFRLGALKDRPLGKLSTGERQRAFLARAVLQKPSFLLLDEPTNHLDPGGVNQFWQALLRDLPKGKSTVILSTHDLHFVENHCDWVVAMRAGALVFSGNRRDFLTSLIYQTLFD